MLADVPVDAAIMTEEPFGPVAIVTALVDAVRAPLARAVVLVVFRHPSPRRWSRCRSTTQSST